MARGLPQIEHLLRRAGFGASADDLQTFGRMPSLWAAAALVDFERVDDDVDAKIGEAA